LGDDFGDQVARAGLGLGAAVEAADKWRVAGIEVTENFHAGWKVPEHERGRAIRQA
jgi:hypothetical protein